MKLQYWISETLLLRIWRKVQIIFGRILFISKYLLACFWRTWHWSFRGKSRCLLTEIIDLFVYVYDRSCATISNNKTFTHGQLIGITPKLCDREAVLKMLCIIFYEIHTFEYVSKPVSIIRYLCKCEQLYIRLEQAISDTL